MRLIDVNLETNYFVSIISADGVGSGDYKAYDDIYDPLSC